MRFKLTIEYSGTRYSGWQIQSNARTIQGEIERAIQEVTRASRFELYGSGRTDAGVHALAQVAHLDLDTTLPPDQLRRRLNESLPSDIVILRVEKAHTRFHARHDAVGRSYLYQVSTRKTAFAKAFVWWVKQPLSVPAMEAAGQALVGFHDFRSFSDADPSEQSTDVALDVLSIHQDEELIVVHLQGSHFIWKMVRRIVGVLVSVGRGDLSREDVERMLTSRSEVPARLTAPASGLFLERVYYPGERRAGTLRALSSIRRA
jgi:tRNA pseudouridine38-40 synthase